MTPDYLTHLKRVVDTLKRQHTLQDACRAVEEASQALVGHRLFTVLYVAPGAREVARVYSSDPVAYPIAGRKLMGPTPWGEQVIHQRRAWVGYNDDDISWAFPDHALIRSLGLSSSLNIAVSYDGACVGTLNLLDVADHYREEQVALIEPLGAMLVPLLIAEANKEAEASR